MFADTIINTASQVKGYYVSEQAVTIVFADRIGLQTTELTSDINRLLLANPFPGFKTTVPAYTTLTVYFDPQRLLESKLKGWDCLQRVLNYINQLPESNEIQPIQANMIEIPVCYDKEFGLDLEELAISAQLSVDDIVRLHSAAIYTVAMIGFTPGFAYLGGLDRRLFAPRKQSPRAAVPAGSVAIGGEQTGIYPLTIPGGWQIIGRTPLNLFDTNRDQPALLKTGDKVQFKPIDRITFDELAHAN